MFHVMKTVKSIRIDDKVWKELKIFAEDTNSTISGLIEDAIKEYLFKQKTNEALAKLRKLPKVGVLGKRKITRKDIYAGRY